MRLMVLDRCTVTRGDISLDELKRFGELKIYDVIPENRLAETIRGADAVICNKARITSDAVSYTHLIICRELLRGKVSDDILRPDTPPEARTEEYYKKRPCLQIIGDAAELLERML